MAFLGMGVGAVAAAKAVDIAADAVGALIKKYVPNPDDQVKMQLEVFKSLQSSDLAQMDINKAEAANPNLFVSGWRPAVGWVGVFGLAYNYLLFPFFLAGVGFFYPEKVTALLNVLPKLDSNMIELVFALLGLGGMRSWEKAKGVAR